MKRLHWWAFFVPPRDTQHTLFWHQLRDGERFMFLREAIAKAGIQSTFSGVIRNVPGAPSPDEFGPDDILVATTRFPLDDDDEDGHTVVPGDNELEKRFGVPRGSAAEGAGCLFFRHLNRSLAILQDGVTKLLKPECEKHDMLRFNNKRGARVIQYRRGRDIPADIQRTVAYLINIPNAWPGGPGLIWSFGMSGETGLIWNKIVCDEYARFLCRPHFVMATFDVPEWLRGMDKDRKDYGPGNFEWATARALNVTLVAEAELTPAVLQGLGF